MALPNTTIYARLRALLGVEPGEERATGLPATLYFVLAASFVFVQTTAYGLFIQEFGARNLPFAYLSIAIFASLLESTRYLNAREVDWDRARRQALLDRMKTTGQKIEQIDVEAAFRHVREVTLEAGDVLIEAGAPSGFVYLPLGEGLHITPLGGYQSVTMKGWFPVGSTGVIRGATRNAHVTAGQEVAVLIIPKEVYLRHWYWPYTFQQVREVIMQEHGRSAQG